MSTHRPSPAYRARLFALCLSLANPSSSSFLSVIPADSETIRVLPQDELPRPSTSKLPSTPAALASPTLEAIASATSQLAKSTEQVLKEASYLDIADYYFQSELHHYYTESMRMGGYDDDFDSETQPYFYYSHLKTSLMSELDRVRTQKLKNAYDDIRKESMVDLIKRSKLHLDANNNNNNNNNNHTASHDDNNNMSSSRQLNWENWDFERIYSFFKCDEHARDHEKKLYNPYMWSVLREGLDSDLFHENDQYATGNNNSNNDDPPPYYADFSKGKGRGAFASRNIQKGEVVHDGSKSTVFFRDGASWREYLMSLRSRKMACDVLEWTWMQDVTNTGNLLLCLNLNDAAFMNDGGEEYANIATRTNTSLVFYALRDIAKDEELLYDYDLFETNWEEFDL